MKRSLYILFAVILIIVGLIILPLPIPFGLIMIVIGIAILTKNSTSSKAYLISLRQKHPHRSTQLNRFKPYLPGFVKTLVEETDPDSHQVKK